MLTISCMINMRYLRWDAANVIFMSSLSILVTLLLLAYPVFFAWKLTKNFDSLDERSFKKKYGKFYEELDLRNGKMVLLQPVWFLLRRFTLSVMVVFLNTTVIWQVALMTFTIIMQVIILGRIEPFSVKSKYHYEMFSEVILMLIMYHLICFTPFVPDVEVRFPLGYSVSGLICLHLAVSIFLILKESYTDLRMKNKVRKASKVHNS